MTRTGCDTTNPASPKAPRAGTALRLRRLAAWTALAVLIFLAASTSAIAQNIQFTQGSVGSGLDNTIQIPIAAYPGRGSASLPVTLYYSSRVWRVGYINSVNVNVDGFQVKRAVAEAIYAEHSTAGWTTSLDVPQVEWPKDNDIYWYDGKPYHQTVGGFTFRVARVLIHMPDGSTHELRKSDQIYQDMGEVDKVGTFYAVDGSRLRYDSSNASEGVLYMPDGSHYVMEVGTVQFIDRNGNALNYNPQTRQWTDTLGGVGRGDIAMPWPASPQAGVDYSYTPPGFSAPYIFKWKNLSDVLTTPDAQGQTPTLKAMSDNYLPLPGQPPTAQGGNNFPQPVGAGTPSLFTSAAPNEESDSFTYVVGRGQGQGQLFNPVVLSEVVLPNGLSYKFTYNVFGEIDKIIYPTGGYERCQYDSVLAMGHITPPYDEASRGVKFRFVSPNGTGGSDEAQWKYEASIVPFTLSFLVKVTAPDLTYTETYRHNAPGGSFGYEDARNGVVEEERAYDKDPSLGGVMLRRTLTKWDQSSATFQRPTPTNPPNPGTYTAYRNPRPSKTISLILDTLGDALAKKVTYQYAAVDPNNASAIEMSTGLDRTGMTETQFAAVDQTTAQGGSIDTTSDSYTYPPASSSVTTYLNNSAYRDRNILGLVTSVVLEDAALQPISKTETFYDEGGIYSMLPPYGDLGTDLNYVDPGTTLRANPTTVRRYTDIASSSYLETHAQFDQYGNPVNFWDERGIQSQKSYSATYRHAYLTQATTAVPDPSGQHGSTTAFTSSSTYDPVTGHVLTTTDANGQVTTFSYANDQGVADPLNRLRKVTRPDGGWTKTSYNDVLGNLYVHTESRLDASRSTHAYQFFDKLGRTSRSFALEAGQTYIVAETQYDQMGRVSQTSNPFRTTINGTGDASQVGYWATADQPAFWTTTTYDALGRVKQVTLPDSTAVTTDYQEGVYTTVTDQAGRQRRQKVDALGRIIRVDEPDATGNLGATNAPVQPSFYEYDTQGNVVRISQGLAQQGTDPENAASYTQHRYFKYDALSRLTYERQAEQAGTITTPTDPLTGNSLWSRRLSYDETLNSVSYKGLLTTAEDARHVVTNFYYDQLSRNYQVAYSDDTPTVTSRYDQARTDAPPSGQQPVTFFNKGRLTEVTTAATASLPQTQQLYDYDLMGRTARQQQVVDVNTYALRYSYNLGGGLASETYPSGRVVSYGYDSAGRLLNVASGSTTYAGQMSYRPFGGLESMALGNGTIYSMSYSDTRLQLSSVTLTQGATTVQRYDYKYGQVDMATGAVDETKNDGQVARIEGTIGTQRQWQQRFQYDSLGRLTSAGEFFGDTLQNLSYQVNYEYLDAFGNRYQRRLSNPHDQNNNPTNPFPQSWVEAGDYDQATNRFTSTSMTYDDAGNVTTDSRFRMLKFQYDANNRQKQSSTLTDTGAVQSVYDGAGHRVATKAAGQITSVMVYDAAGDLVAEYGGSVSTNGTRYLMGDHQGSTRVVMNNTGGVVFRHDYLPFGEDSLVAGIGMRTTTQGYSQADGVRQKYAGMEGDDATGMSHTLWREYENLSARWTAPDPYGGSMSLSSPQSFNRYAYVNNDPVNKVDPTGLMLSDIGVFQTDNEGLAQRLETDAALYQQRYFQGQTGHVQQQQQQQPQQQQQQQRPTAVPAGPPPISSELAGSPAYEAAHPVPAGVRIFVPEPEFVLNLQLNGRYYYGVVSTAIVTVVDKHGNKINEVFYVREIVSADTKGNPFPKFTYNGWEDFIGQRSPLGESTPFEESFRDQAQTNMAVHKVPSTTSNHTWVIVSTSRGTLITVNDQRTVGNKAPVHYDGNVPVPNYQVSLTVTNVTVDMVGSP